MPRARFLVIALLSWLAPSCYAQTTLTAAEYFFDADPGVGNATSLTSFTASGNIDFNFSAAASGLNTGMHILAIRVKDNTNAWSIPSYSIIYVLNDNPLLQEAISSAEYFFDTDPGSGNATPVPGISTGVLIDVTYQANASALAAGFHLLGVRTKNINGQWGTPSFSSFYVLNGSIVNLEYYIDTDPGSGTATQVPVPPSSSIDMDVIIPSASLTAGPHTLGVRASPMLDMWGTTQTTSFIVKDSQTITFSSLSAKTFGDASFDLTATSSSGLAIAYTSSDLAVATISGATVTIVGAGTTTITASQAGDGTYFPAADNPQTLTVNKANQTIAFPAMPTKTVSDPDFTLGATTGSGLPITYTSSNLAVATISGNTVTILGAGITDITATQTGDSNYNAAADVVQTLTVNKANQTITFSALPAKTLGDADFTLSATASSGLPVAFATSDLSVATITGSTVTIVGGGTTNITASQAGNVFYNAAVDVVQPQLVQVVNSPPSLTTSAVIGFYISGDVVVNNVLVVADTDGNLQSALVSIITGYQSAEDQLVFTNQSGISGSFNVSNGTLALTGTTSVANYQAALRTVQYRNTATSPSTADRAITFQVNDGTVASNIVTSTIAVNKPPVITATPQVTQAGGNIVFLVADILSDPDNNLDLTTLTIVSAQGANITISNGIITIDYSNVSDYNGTDQLTITVCDQGGKCKTENVSIEVGADVEVFNGISANGDGANDYLRIRYLPAGTKVSIYNRWGDSVYEMDDYDNTDAARRFEGFNNDGNELTSGTYFYKLTLPDGKARTGYLHLKR